MSDYSAMSDDELDTEIARRQGWTNFVVSGLTSILYGNPPGESMLSVPDWSSDLNAASELLKVSGGSLYWTGHKWRVDAYPGHWLVEHDDAARAISHDWLVYTDLHPTQAMLRDDAPRGATP